MSPLPQKKLLNKMQSPASNSATSSVSSSPLSWKTRADFTGD
jgi:hypothetical protein